MFFFSLWFHFVSWFIPNVLFICLSTYRSSLPSSLPPSLHPYSLTHSYPPSLFSLPDSWYPRLPSFLIKLFLLNPHPSCPHFCPFLPYNPPSHPFSTSISLSKCFRIADALVDDLVDEAAEEIDRFVDQYAEKFLDDI